MIGILRQMKCASTENKISDRHTNVYACPTGEKYVSTDSINKDVNRRLCLLGVATRPVKQGSWVRSRALISSEQRLHIFTPVKCNAHYDNTPRQYTEIFKA